MVPPMPYDVRAGARGAGFPWIQFHGLARGRNRLPGRTNASRRNLGNRNCLSSRLHLRLPSGPEPDVDGVAPLDPRAVRAIAARTELRAPFERSGHLIRLPFTLSYRHGFEREFQFRDAGLRIREALLGIALT